MEDESLTERYCSDPGRNRALPPEMHVGFTAKWQVVRVPEAIERGYATYVKRRIREPLQSQEHSIGIERLRGAREYTPSERVEPSALYVLADELTGETLRLKPTAGRRYAFGQQSSQRVQS